MTPTPEQLLAEATALWSARGERRRELSAHETMLGEIPVAAGQLMTVTRKARGTRMPIFRFRIWSVAPNGRRVPLTFGMNISAQSLPALAGLISHALRVELAELETATDETRHPLASAKLREAFHGVPRGSVRGDIARGAQRGDDTWADDDLPAWAAARNGVANPLSTGDSDESDATVTRDEP